MIYRLQYLFTAFVLCLLAAGAVAQEGPTATKPGDTPPPGVEKKYWELTHSKDVKVKGLAERYMTMMRFQEWGTASGKSIIARYVSHDPDLKHVKLAVPKGTGKDRVLTEYTVDVEKQLNKTSQARVKQIDALQKKLDDMAGAAKPGDVAGAPAGPEGPANPVHQERGAPGQGAAAGPEAGQQPVAAAEQPDPSASEPDPLGFAELPPVAAGPAGPGAISPEQNPGAGIAPPIPGQPAPGQPTPGQPAPGQNLGAADPKQWRTDFAAFVGNLKVEVDPIGQPVVQWGELREVGNMNSFVLKHKDPASPASPEEENPATISQRLGDVHWLLPLEKVEKNASGAIEPRFIIPPLPKPLTVQFALADGESAENWTKLAPGTPAAVTGRLLISEPNKILVKVKLGAK